MAKATLVASFLLVIFLLSSFQGNDLGVEAKVGVNKHLGDIISTPCGDAICTLEYYDTEYVMCGGEKLPAYSNCCVLQSCLPDVTSCSLYLANDQGTVACSF
ncbi:hypothetical protein GOP47_0001828 [Adiantum capillus-veneris]|uniref:Uncharacterized protein n=1 Tax=Adiantum capillus-veneris TaxID=13818 RepID=A0A9D4V9S4_ADICA|nr:hypothetical protein GOP47_0001828 [Adiantum capillus-veneris]